MKMLRMLLLLGLVSQHASGVEVYEGVESVLLPCQIPADVYRNSTAAVWDRDEFTNPLVHLRLQSGDDLTDQSDLYKHRTSMRADALQTGDLSLTLRNPTGSDSGTYTCTTRRQGDDLSEMKVELKVREPLPPVWPKVLLAFLVTVCLLAAAFGLFVYFVYKRMKSSEALQVEMVEVTDWEKFVLLPFQTTADLPQDVTVEWRRSDCKHIKVYVFQRSQNQVEEQDQVYRGRTEMNEDPLRTGDLSLMLKDPYLTDSGAYICTIYSKDGQILRQKTVTLSFKVPETEMVEVRQREKFVWFPFETKPDLPQDITVEWRRSDSKNMKVHVLQNGKKQPHNQDQDYRGRTEMKEEPLRTGDLSLMLKYPRLTDRGVYTCTVYNKDAHILLQKVVRFTVRGLQPEMVEVTQGQESVLLPFKITAGLPQDVTVEWRITAPKHMKVHVYESGENQPDQQHQYYRGRTEMSEEPLRTGDLSLTLKDPRFTDSGVYTCIVYDGEFLQQKSVTLRVRDPVVEMVEVTEWKKFVLLPFKITAALPQDVTVEWILTEPKHMKVHMYQRGQNELDIENCDYRGRTEMNKEPLKTRDLSLTLKDPHFTDSGVYFCTVCNKDGLMLLQKSVSLSVREYQVGMVEVTQGVESVLLPFKTTAGLPQDVTVEWRLIEPKLMKVHVYESGENQPDQQHQVYRGRTEMSEKLLRTGDLSLTLKDPCLNDTGVYTCTICNNNGYVLLQKVVTLHVKASLLGTMAEMLPCLNGLRRRTAPRTETKEELRNHEDVPLMADQSV